MHSKRKTITVRDCVVAAGAASLAICTSLTAGSVSVPNTFVPGSVIIADEVNDNFTALEEGLNQLLTTDVQFIDVDCTSAPLALRMALAMNNGEALQFDITGTCDPVILKGRRNITLKGADGGNGRIDDSNDEGDAAITVESSQGIVIDNLELESSRFDGPVLITTDSSVTLRDSQLINTGLIRKGLTEFFPTSLQVHAHSLAVIVSGVELLDGGASLTGLLASDQSAIQLGAYDNLIGGAAIRDGSTLDALPDTDGLDPTQLTALTLEGGSAANLDNGLVVFGNLNVREGSSVTAQTNFCGECTTAKGISEFSNTLDVSGGATATISGITFSDIDVRDGSSAVVDSGFGFFNRAKTFGPSANVSVRDGSSLRVSDMNIEGLDVAGNSSFRGSNAYIYTPVRVQANSSFRLTGSSSAIDTFGGLRKVSAQFAEVLVEQSSSMTLGDSPEDGFDGGPDFFVPPSQVRLRLNSSFFGPNNAISDSEFGLFDCTDLNGFTVSSTAFDATSGSGFQDFCSS